MEWYLLAPLAFLAAILLRPVKFAESAEDSGGGTDEPAADSPAEDIPEPADDNRAPKTEAIAEPTTEPEPSDLLDYEDEFGVKHRVSPQTAAWMRYQENRVRDLASRGEPTRQPATQEEPETLDDVTFAKRFRVLENQVGGLARMFADARNQSVESARMTGTGRIIDDLAQSTPYMKSNPALTEEVRRVVTDRVRSLRGAPTVDDASFANAVRQEAMAEARRLHNFASAMTRASAETRAEAGRKAPPPAGGLNASAAPKSQDEVDWEQPNKVASDMYKELQRMSRG